MRSHFLSPFFLVLLIGCRSNVGPNFPSTSQQGLSADTGDTGDALTDSDGDGYTAEEDCDDEDAAVNPAAEEVCDGVDNDCDGEVDVGAADGDTWYIDADADGFGDSAEAITACEPPEGYADNADDCDDTTDAARPDGEEICDGIDNDCDGLTDSADDSIDPSSTASWYADGDGDGFGGAADFVETCDQPEGYVLDSTDCDDADEATNPGADETCDGVDNDCDKDVDEDAVDTLSWYADADADGFGDADSTAAACEQPSGYVADSADCDDDDSAVNPDAAEVCDSVDNDCDGLTDDDDDSIDPSVGGTTFYADSDGDSYGDADDTTLACALPGGYTSDASDCDDSDEDVNPGADEVCDGTDNDCDGLTDDADDSVDTSGGSTFYADADSDGFGDADSAAEACEQPDGYVSDDTDCDDSDSDISPGAAEVCDEVDNDCDGDIDDTDTDIADAQTWYRDFDGDSYGTASYSVVACEQPTSYVSTAGDCDDSDSDISPGAAEVCDGMDNDCDSLTDDDDDNVDTSTGGSYYLDDDRDGFGDADTSSVACEQPSGYVEDSSDCDDADFDVNPDAAEVCDSVDNDCDGLTDDDDDSVDTAFGGTTFYADDDSDGYGDPSSTTEGCEAPAGHVDNSDDCDDTDADISPDADEVCDSVDNDCDGDIDDDDASVDLSTAGTYYEDSDRDGYGDSGSTAEGCDQPAGYVSDDTDCDDDNGAINPGADEICDSEDNDCDGDIDDDDSSVDLSTGATFYTDGDNDGYGDPDDATRACEQPDGAVSDDTDCDDDDGDVNPLAQEICDGVDNDCDDDIDDDDVSLDTATGSTFYSDDDGDGYGDEASPTLACEQPEDHVENDEDCDDSDGAIHPDAEEVCDNADNDCDGDVDTGASDATTWYGDADGDGFGGTTFVEESCDALSGFVTNSDDCNDLRAAINPDAAEVCDSIDNDCDGDIDDDDDDLDTASGSAWYLDADGDGYGDPGTATETCEALSGYVSNDEDCDDSDSAINPDADEVCDGVDNNCDGDTDDADVGLDTATADTYYLDDDRDGYGDPAESGLYCERPSGYVSNATDCDDDDEDISPDAEEVCDGQDNDCDGDTDDDDDDVDLSTGGVYYSDEDGDGYGDPDQSVEQCSQPSGTVTDSTDCDDTNDDANPGEAEVCDGVDNDCDGDTDDDDSGLDTSTADTYYLDDDGDGYGDPDEGGLFCEQPSDHVTDATDCDDTDGDVRPDATEVCNGTDDDCDGDTDDDDSSLDRSTADTYYADDDGDGFGDPSQDGAYCDQPSDYVEDDTDCDDGAAAVNPDADEICDSIDNDCDGDIDDDDDNVDTSGGGTFYYDDDGDGYGDTSDSVAACNAPDDAASVGGDCDDSDGAINPDAEEVCDGEDNDCDGDTDDDDSSLDTATADTYYLDDDRDGFGDPDEDALYCDRPSGYVSNNEDCDDDERAVNPDATEVCNDTDDDCDGDIDDDDSSLDTSTASVYYADDDSDGFGDPDDSGRYCDQPAGTVEDSDDCDDTDGAINPDAAEVCDGEDNDCDGDIDDDDRSLDTSTASVYYADDDSDGFGDEGTTGDYCDQPAGYVSTGGDCDDRDGAINPDAEEVCDGEDNDCDGDTDDDDSDLDTATADAWYLDGDDDGYGDPDDELLSCEQPSGYVDDDTDCDDSDVDTYPGADELCDEVDNDCDEEIDEAYECTLFRSCQEILDADSTSADGYYDIDPDEDGTETEVYCDMTTDGGGWTLVADWDRRNDGDSLSDFESLMTENYNNMGNFSVDSSSLRWNDGSSSAKAMDYSIEVIADNDGEVMFSVDYYGYSMEDSSVFFYVTTDAGDDEDLYCLGLRSGASSSYSTTERSYLPNYTCSVSATSTYTKVISGDLYSFSDPIEQFSITSLHYDNGSGDYSYLYSFTVWVR